MNSWIDITGWTLLHFVWQGAVIAIAVAILLRLLGHALPHTGYAVGCAGLALMLAAPVVTARLLLPGVTPLQSVVSVTNAADRHIAAAAPASNDGATAAAPIRTSRSPVAFNAETVLPLVVALWVGGVAILFLQLAGGYWRVRRMHAVALIDTPSRWHEAGQRIAMRLGLSRAIAIVDSSAVETPTVMGWMRPVVLLPVAALANLTPGQVEAILAHELAHIRRHDFVVNVLQTVAETLLFYHPAVWWLSGRIRAERENCCDDIAVDVCGDAVEYAAALTEIAAWSVSTPSLVVGATGGSLLHRVRRVLGVKADGPRRVTSGIAIVAAALAFVVLVGSWRLVMIAQTPDDTAPTAQRGFGPPDVNRLLGFELLPGPPQYPTDDPRGTRAWGASIEHPAGEMALIGFSARSLIRDAYALGEIPVAGVPDWMDRETFDILIRSDVEVAANGISDPDAVRMAMRQYFEQQLNLSWHFETREFPAYALVKASPDGALGPNIKPTSDSCIDAEKLRAARESGTPLGQGGRWCGVDNNLFGVTAAKVTMADFAREMKRNLSLVLGREVVDRTGLTGAFDFDVRIGFLPFAAIAHAYPSAAAVLYPAGVRSIFTALPEQLGVKLEETTASHQVLVIDHIDKPATP